MFQYHQEIPRIYEHTLSMRGARHSAVYQYIFMLYKAVVDPPEVWQWTVPHDQSSPTGKLGEGFLRTQLMPIPWSRMNTMKIPSGWLTALCI